MEECLAGASELSGVEEAISVSVRIRPLNGKELKSGCKDVWVPQDGQSVYSVADPGQHTFDNVFSSEASTRKVYDRVAKGIVSSVVGGMNGTVFAYGQTASGKTFTMQGEVDQPGILCLAAQQVFEEIERNEKAIFLLQVSYMEVFNEQVKDLLSDTDANLRIREDRDRGFFVDGLVHKSVTSVAELLAAKEEGERRRHVGETNMNMRSSRSHTIFCIRVEKRVEEDEEFKQENRRLSDDSHLSCESGNAMAPSTASSAVRRAIVVGKLNLVDLAGSENARATGAEGGRLKEGGNINKSLLTLSRVISQLAGGKAKAGGFINWRDSKLTQILQPSLAGNCRTAIVCCITPANKYMEETKSTLQFAKSAKQIRLRAVVNEVLSSEGELKRLKRTVQELRNELASQQENALKHAAMEKKVQTLSKMLVNSAPSALDVDTLSSEAPAKKKTKRETWSAADFALQEEHESRNEAARRASVGATPAESKEQVLFAEQRIQALKEKLQAYSSANASITATLEAYKAELANDNALLEKQRDSIRALEQRAQSQALDAESRLISTRDQLRELLEDKQLESQELRERLGSLETQLERCQRVLEQSQREAAQLREDERELLNTMAAEQAKVSAVIQELQDSLRSASEEKESLMEKLDALHSTLAQADLRQRDLELALEQAEQRSELHAQHSQKQSKSQGRLIEEFEASLLRAELDRDAAQLSLKDSHEAFSAQLEQRELARQSALEELERTRAEKEQLRESRRVEVEALEARMLEHEATLSALSAEASDVKDALAAKCREVAQLEAVVESSEAARLAENAEHVARSAELQVQLAAFEERLAASQEESARASALQAENADLRAQLDAVVESSEAARLAENAEHVARSAELQVQLAAFEERLAASQEESARACAMQAENADLRAQLEAALSSKSVDQDLDATIAVLRAQVAEESAKRIGSAAGNDELRSQLTELRAETCELEAQIANLRAQLGESDAVCSDLRAQTAESAARRGEAEAECSKISVQLANVEAANDELKEELARTRETLAREAEATLAEASAKLAERTEALRVAQYQLVTLEETQGSQAQVALREAQAKITTQEEALLLAEKRIAQLEESRDMKSLQADEAARKSDAAIAEANSKLALQAEALLLAELRIGTVEETLRSQLEAANAALVVAASERGSDDPAAQTCAELVMAQLVSSLEKKELEELLCAAQQERDNLAERLRREEENAARISAEHSEQGLVVQETVQDMMRELHVMKRERQAMAAEVQREQELRSKLESRLSQLQERLDEGDMNNQALENQLRMEREVRSTLEQRLESLRADLKTRTDELVQASLSENSRKAELANARTELDQVEAECERQRERIAKLEKVKITKEQAEKIKELREDHRKLKLRYAEVAASNETLVKSQAALRERVAQQHHQDNTTLVEHVSRTARAFGILEAPEPASFISLLAERITALQTERDEFEQELRVLEGQQDEARSGFSDMHAQDQKALQSALRENAKLKEQAVALRSRLAEFETDLGTLRAEEQSEREKLLQQLEEQRESVRYLEKENLDLIVEVRKLRERTAPTGISQPKPAVLAQPAAALKAVSNSKPEGAAEKKEKTPLKKSWQPPVGKESGKENEPEQPPECKTQ